METTCGSTGGMKDALVVPGVRVPLDSFEYILQSLDGNRHASKNPAVRRTLYGSANTDPDRSAENGYV
jgi:hypothetical protein